MAELNDTQRKLLQLIFEPFHKDARWPTSLQLQKRMYDDGISVEAVLQSLPPGLVIRGYDQTDPLKLSVEGLVATGQASAELEVFLEGLSLAVERFRDEPPVFATAELRDRLKTSEALPLRWFDEMLRTEVYVAHSSERAPDGGPFKWKSNELAVWEFKDVDSIERYLEVKKRVLHEDARSPAPNPFYLAQYGITVGESADSPGSSETELRPTDLFQLIEDLKGQRQQAERIMAGPVVSGETDLWQKRSTALATEALGSAHYSVAALRDARPGSMRQVPSVADSAMRSEIQVENRNQRISPFLPALDDTIREAERRLQRMTGGASLGSASLPEPSGLPSVRFDFIKNADLRAMAARDYAELHVAASFKNHKSMALLAGSVVESVVLDLLLAKGVLFDEIMDLSAGKLYQRAIAEGLLKGRQQSAADASRDTRNFVHPAVELKEGRLSAAQAELSVNLMKVILGELGAP